MTVTDRIELIPAEHPSGVLRIIAKEIGHDQWWSSDAERTAVLRPLACDERISRVDASPEAEQHRAKICAQWALSVAAPMALDAAAARLRERYPESADVLAEHVERLRAAPTVENARAARVAASHTGAAYAATAYASSAGARDDVPAAVCAACAARRAGADIRPELIALFERLLDVRGGES